MSNKKIALNTAVSYLRTLFAAALALFSSRWVLDALGVIDFGLLNVVGSVIIFITFFNSVLAISVSRHFAFSIGKGDPTEVGRWFNAALGIHILLASALVLAGLPLGEAVIRHILHIPGDRLEASLLIFRISLASAFFSMVSVPFQAMFSAKQRLAEVAGWGVVQAVLGFVLASQLHWVAGDRLVFYAMGLVVIVIAVQIALIARAGAAFTECRLVRAQLFDRERAKEVFSFAAWNVFGSSGALFRDQGGALLLNLFFGPSANAAYGIATQLSNQANQLSTAMIGAFAPEITASEGRGDRARVLCLAERASRFGTILILFLAIPLIAEMGYVLKLWLRTPPEYTVVLSQLILAAYLVDRLSIGYMLAVQAHGRIAGYQATLGGCLLMTLPLAWLFLKAGHPPTSIGIAFAVTMFVTSIGRVLWGRHLLGMPADRWFTSVVLPCLAVAGCAAATAALTRYFMGPSLLRLVMVGVGCTASIIGAAFLFAMDHEEKKAAVTIIRSALTKFSGVTRDEGVSPNVTREEHP